MHLIIPFLFCLISPILLLDLEPIHELEDIDVYDWVIREISVRVGSDGCSHCFLYIWLKNPEGYKCTFPTDEGYAASYLPNSIITRTRGQLDVCDDWNVNLDPTEEGWRIMIHYWPQDPFGTDNIRLNDAHIYFSTDVGSSDGIYCSIDYEFDAWTDRWFSCHRSTKN